MTFKLCFNYLNNFLLKTRVTNLIANRGKKQWMRPYLASLYKRRLDQGPEPERPRSVWSNWNFDCELYGFEKRLGENFDQNLLKIAFINKCYVEKERIIREEFKLIDDKPFTLQDNQELTQTGHKFLCKYLEEYISENLKNLPKDGVMSVVDYLSNNEMLCYIASNLGVKDLIFSADFPPADFVIANTFKAIIGALLQSSGNKRAGLFVRDLVATQLIGNRIDDIWKIPNPMGRLIKELKEKKLESLESRLLWSSGENTILSTYMVGIYSNKKLIGKGPGETISIAEEMAARDALNIIYQITDNKAPLNIKNISD